MITEGATRSLDQGTRPLDRLILLVLVADGALLVLLGVCFVNFTVGTVPVPLSALVAAVGNPWLVRAAGALARTGLGAAGPFVAWLIVVCGMGFTGPGGDVIVTDGWPALLFIIGGMVPAAFVLGRVLRAKAGGD
jgi:hypothetical protein